MTCSERKLPARAARNPGARSPGFIAGGRQSPGQGRAHMPRSILRARGGRGSPRAGLTPTRRGSRCRPAEGPWRPCVISGRALGIVTVRSCQHRGASRHQKVPVRAVRHPAAGAAGLARLHSVGPGLPSSAQYYYEEQPFNCRASWRGTAPAGRAWTSPLARNLAREHGIDLTIASGTGPGGRIVRAGIEDAIRQLGAAQPMPQRAAAAPAGPAGPVPVTSAVPPASAAPAAAATAPAGGCRGGVAVHGAPSDRGTAGRQRARLRTSA
jgi:pyruvate/2-oxoglutarate dehydrogenase complex dihydrolipoamide acyltransferase (E2) component